MVRVCKLCNKRIENRQANAKYCSQECNRAAVSGKYTDQQRKVRIQQMISNFKISSEKGVKIIYSVCGKEILVDASLYDSLLMYEWYISKGYASFKNIKMHLLIKPWTTPIKGYAWDHIDRNKLNNTSDNLRYVTTTQNNCNKEPKEGKLYKGVRLTKYGKYRAEIKHNGISIHLGNFVTPEEAALAYNEAVLIYQGEYGYLNKIQ